MGCIVDLGDVVIDCARLATGSSVWECVVDVVCGGGGGGDGRAVDWGGIIGRSCCVWLGSGGCLYVVATLVWGRVGSGYECSRKHQENVFIWCIYLTRLVLVLMHHHGPLHSVIWKRFI